MKQVMLQFKLVGKTNFLKHKETNKNALEAIKDVVRFQFGDRPVFVVNEQYLDAENAEVPDFYSAGWFVSSQEKDENIPSELVVIATGSTLAQASSNLMAGVTHINWDNVASDI